MQKLASSDVRDYDSAEEDEKEIERLEKLLGSKKLIGEGLDGTKFYFPTPKFRNSLW